MGDDLASDAEKVTSVTKDLSSQSVVDPKKQGGLPVGLNDLDLSISEKALAGAALKKT